MKLKSKLPEYTIVIATLGEEVLLNTLYSLNKGDYVPKEIIVSLPKGKKISSQTMLRCFTLQRSHWH